MHRIRTNNAQHINLKLTAALTEGRFGSAYAGHRNEPSCVPGTDALQIGCGKLGNCNETLGQLECN